MRFWQIICLILGILVLVRATHTANVKTASPVDGFHSWKLVNPNPVWITSKLDALCRNLTQREVNGQKSNPHLHKFISVYVNGAGALAMDLGTDFPLGSVIVKEKHKGSDLTAEMSTVMIKRKQGYNPKCGDWEFATLDSTGKKITSRGEIASCMGCHEAQAKLD